jgi:hypothetical protein
MGRLRDGARGRPMRRIPWLSATAVLIALAAPGAVQAQGGPFGPFPQEEYPAGITVSGSGLARVIPPARLREDTIEKALARANPVAVARAVRDARRRAEAIARGMGLGAGGVRQLEVNQLFFDRGRHCRRASRGARPRCTVPTFAAASVTLTFEIQGGADPEEEGRTLEASASALRPVEPTPPGSEHAIREALLEARDAATPAAAAKARAQISAAAAAASVSVGSLVSIVEQSGFPYYGDASLGTLGARRYCRIVRRRRFLGIDPVTGRPRIERGPPRRRCSFPRRLTVSIEMTYTVGP